MSVHACSGLRASRSSRYQASSPGCQGGKQPNGAQELDACRFRIEAHAWPGRVRRACSVHEASSLHIASTTKSRSRPCLDSIPHRAQFQRRLAAGRWLQTRRTETKTGHKERKGGVKQRRGGMATYRMANLVGRVARTRKRVMQMAKQAAAARLQAAKISRRSHRLTIRQKCESASERAKRRQPRISTTSKTCKNKNQGSFALFEKHILNTKGEGCAATQSGGSDFRQRVLVTPRALHPLLRSRPGVSSAAPALVHGKTPGSQKTKPNHSASRNAQRARGRA